MECADNYGIYGSETVSITDLFDYPLISTSINVFKASNDYKFRSMKRYTVDEILCKLAVVVVYEETAFIPLLHTLSSNERL